MLYSVNCFTCAQVTYTCPFSFSLDANSELHGRHVATALASSLKELTQLEVIRHVDFNTLN